MSTDHRASAAKALANLVTKARTTEGQISYASEATAHALLYAGDQLAALVEQQKLQMLIGAYSTGALPLNGDEREAVRAHIKAALGLADGGES
ncbi:hypothetical protein ACWDNI_35735 [Nocardia niigatensis]